MKKVKEEIVLKKEPFMHIYIYIERERERESVCVREREKERERERGILTVKVITFPFLTC